MFQDFGTASPEQGESPLRHDELFGSLGGHDDASFRSDGHRGQRCFAVSESDTLDDKPVTPSQDDHTGV